MTHDLENQTINRLLDASCRRFAANPAAGMAFKQPLTYAELHRQTLELAALLRQQGIKRGERVAILAENSPPWGLAYLATVRLGAVVVPILPDFTEADVHHILHSTEAKLLFTTQRQVEKIYELAPNRLKKVIALDDYDCTSCPVTVEAFYRFLARAKELPANAVDRVAADGNAVKADDLAAVIYTSGTSGHSKAVMLSHGNLCANVRSAISLCPEVEPHWTFLSILPMSHTYEFTIGFLLPLLHGCRIVYAGKTPTPTILERICRRERPTITCVVPMVMEKIYKKRIVPGIEKSLAGRLAFRVPALRKTMMRRIGSRLLDFFGGELKLLAIGGAPLNIEVERFLREAEFPYLVGYGLTEAAPLIASGPMHDPGIALGSTGKPVPGVEVRIVDIDLRTGVGEIHARGANIMLGYYRDPESTAATIDADGWLATGDLGRFDEQGNLHVTGRSKSVIVLSSGENIYPEVIEEKLNTDLHVVESLVVARNSKLQAMVYLDYDLIDRETAGRSPTQKRAHIEGLLKQIQQEVNRQLPPYSRLASVVERQEPFNKTATQKIKRYLYTEPL